VSSYEDYADASNHYDTSRIAVGSEVILGNVAAGPVRLHEVRLLDAGCGTGNYAHVLAPHVATVTLVDGSAEMLAVATEKLTANPDATVAESRHATLQDLPFGDATFDAVMTNQVLHHLEDASSGTWPEHRAVFEEYARVIKPNGVLVINTCSQEQVQHGYWGFSLIPKGREALAQRYAPLDVLDDIGRAAGFTPTGRFVPLNAPIQGDAYFDPEGPLSEEWRRADSTWSLSPPEELRAMQEKVIALRERGELDSYVAEHDAQRPHIGQTTFVAFRRAPVPG
jgi:ubiquinone/menaquinone biosynthesis C-methylase UbiE